MSVTAIQVPHNGWRIDVMCLGSDWKAFISRPGGFLSETEIPSGSNQDAVIKAATRIIDAATSGAQPIRLEPTQEQTYLRNFLG